MFQGQFQEFPVVTRTSCLLFMPAVDKAQNTRVPPQLARFGLGINKNFSPIWGSDKLQENVMMFSGNF